MKKNKKIIAIAFATIILITGFSFAEKTDIEEIDFILDSEKIEKEMYADEFRNLFITEKLAIVKNYHEAQIKLYQLYSEELNAEEDIERVLEIRGFLFASSKKEDRINQIIYGDMKNYKENKKILTDVEYTEAKETMRETIIFQKILREEGRKLDKKTVNKIGYINFGKTFGLKELALNYEREGNSEKALALYERILELKYRDTPSMVKIVELSNEMHGVTPIFIENETIREKDLIQKIDNINYVKIKTLRFLDGFEVDFDNETGNTIVKHRSDILRISKNNKLYLNDISAEATSFIKIIDGETYLPFRTLFELLSYTVSYNEDAGATILERNSYKKTEVDDLSVDEVLGNII